MHLPFPQIMLREDSFCPFTGKEDISLRGKRAEPDRLEVAHIIGQSFSAGIKGVSEEALLKVGPLPQTILYHEPH
jgi:hypothetical protein